MQKIRSAVVSSPWTSADATVVAGPASFFGIITNSTAGSVTISDGTTTKLVHLISANNCSLVLPLPIAFSTSIVVDNTGTAHYTVLYASNG